MSKLPISQKCVNQLIDANLDRAREGLRVVEDWCRFIIKRKDLVILLKDWRQQLGALHHESYKRARSIETDQGIGLDHPAQKNRQSLEVISANCSRVQEALRVLEEFSRDSDPELARTAAKIRYGLYEVELKVLKVNIGEERRNKLINSRLCLITSPQSNFIETIQIILKAGVSMVQYRCKDGNDYQRLIEAKKLSLICKKSNALLIINDRLDIALAVDADGVHLGQDDLPIKDVRNIIGSEKLIGRSTHCLKDLRTAENEGCDYLGVGPAFQTKSKPQAIPSGLKFIKEASEATRLPWFAIGGINHSNVQDVLSAGATRIAVIGAIMNAKDPARASIDLLKEVS